MLLSRAFKLEGDDEAAAIERMSDEFIGILMDITETELEFGILLNAVIVVSVLVILLLPPPTRVAVRQVLQIIYFDFYPN